MQKVTLPSMKARRIMLYVHFLNYTMSRPQHMILMARKIWQNSFFKWHDRSSLNKKKQIWKQKAEPGGFQRSEMSQYYIKQNKLQYEDSVRCAVLRARVDHSYYVPLLYYEAKSALSTRQGSGLEEDLSDTSAAWHWWMGSVETWAPADCVHNAVK